MCNGQLLPISQYAALFSLLGTQFGGNGTSNFALPDLRGRVAIHQGQGAGLSSYIMGEASGSQSVTLTVNQMPSHSHTVNATTTPPTSGRGSGSPSNNVPATPTVVPDTTAVDVYGPTPNTTMSAQMIAPAGGSTPVPVIQPFLCVNFVIAYVGIFPSRN
jgi:microcystin-dependent protein